MYTVVNKGIPDWRDIGVSASISLDETKNQSIATRLAELKEQFERDGLRGEVVYRTLREAIVQGIMPEGERVQDRSLAAVLGMSRTPVREALQRLEAEGYLKSVPRLGLVVTEITPQDIEDIYVIRIALEGVAARLAAQRASPGDIEVLSQLHGQIAAATHRGDVQSLSVLNRQFHDTLYRTARNDRLADLLNRMQYTVARFQRSTLSRPERAAEALEEHAILLKAIQDRDTAAAEAVARAHKERAMRARLLMYHNRA